MTSVNYPTVHQTVGEAEIQNSIIDYKIRFPAVHTIQIYGGMIQGMSHNIETNTNLKQNLRSQLD